MVSAQPNGPTVVQVRRTLACPRETAFRAWTDPELVPNWFKPRDGSTPAAEMDVRVGGRYRWALEREGRVAYAIGEYLEVEPPTRLAFTFGWEQMPGVELIDSLVTVEFNDRGDGVEIVITHERLRDEQQGELHAAGWREMLENLEHMLAAARHADTE
jgi:uncharacterized protein YndB with AHSA1/START domain